MKNGGRTEGPSGMDHRAGRSNRWKEPSGSRLTRNAHSLRKKKKKKKKKEQTSKHNIKKSLKKKKSD